MGPFSNNPSTPPTSPRHGSKLPVPDVKNTQHVDILPPSADSSLATRRWLFASLIALGALALAGIATFAIYVYTSNRPDYMLNSAIQNQLSAVGEAGTITYQVQQGNHLTSLSGDFLGYSDPADTRNSTFTVSLGRDTSRTSLSARLFPDTNYFQTAGLNSLGLLLGTSVNSDNQVRLSSLDGQWYTLSTDSLLPSQLKGTFTATDLQTLTQLYLKHPFLTPLEQLADEHISGINCAHLKIGLDNAKLGDFLHAVQSAGISSITLSDTDITALTSSPLANTTLEVWIARSDHTFQQLRFSHNQNDRTDIITATFQSEQAVAQRQSVTRPDSSKNASVLLGGIHDILTR